MGGSSIGGDELAWGREEWRVLASSILLCCNFLPGSLACILLFLFLSGSPTDLTIHQKIYVDSNCT